MTSYDAIILGTGQAGPALAARLAKAGKKVAIAERHLFGGTCVNTGCTPTKALVASAYAAHLARRAADYGVVLPGGAKGGAVTVDMPRVKARKDAIVGSSTHGVESSLRKLDNCKVYQGHARFTGDHEVTVNGERLSAPWIFLNVGGRPAIPPLPGIDTVPFLTSSSMMDVDFVPRHLVIGGGSYVGLEFAQMYRRFGSEVTVVEKAARLIPHEDEDVSLAVQEILQGEGIQLRLSASCLSVAREDDGIALAVDCASGSPRVSGSHLLLALGRRPNTDDLGLEHTAIERDDDGYVKVDDQLATTAPGIWALGDCNRRGAFTHTAYNDYEIVAANLLDGDSRRVSDRFQTYGLFVDPPLGRVGMTEAEARRTGRPILVGKRPMSRISRAIEKGETQGFMKVLVDAESRQILGAAILGTGGDEAVHSVTALMYAHAPYTVMQRAVHIHPTVAELLPTILGELVPLPPAPSKPS